MQRRFPILVLGSGCAPPIAGEWELTDLSWLEGLEVSAGYSAQGSLELGDRDGPVLTGELRVGYDNYTEGYDVDVIPGDEHRAYELDVVEFWTDLDCTMEPDGLTLSCLDTDDDTWTFQR